MRSGLVLLGAIVLALMLGSPAASQEAELRAGKVVYGPQQAECSGSFLLDNVASLCKLIPGASCPTATSSCRTYTRQIFTGTRLGPAPSGSAGSQWNGMGGSGELMADALICALREMSPQLRGAIRTPPLSVGLPVGTVSVVQEVGFKEFRRINPEFKGYRKIILTLPVVGKAEAITQSFTVTKRTYALFGGPVLAGDRPITNSYALNIAAEDKSRTIVIKPLSFTVATPIGPFSVDPEFTYATRTSVIASPYSAPHLDLPNFLGGTKTVRFSDLFGVEPGRAATTKNVSYGTLAQNRTGWLSQLGLGTRGTHADKSVWKAPAGGPSLRPDIDPYKARSPGEAQPSIFVSAKGTIKYPKNPKDMLPSWVFGLPGVNFDAFVTVTPRIEASVAGQFTIANGEGSDYDEPQEFRFSAKRFASASLVSGMRAAASFSVDVRLRIYVKAEFPIVGGKTLVDIDKKIPVPLGGGTPSSSVFAAAAISTGGDLPETLEGIRTLHGIYHSNAASAKAFIEQCYAPSQPPPSQPPTEPAQPGNPKDLFAGVLWPCNICIATGVVADKGKQIHPQHFDTVMKSNPPPGPGHWQCDNVLKTGCMDLCTLNAATNALVIARLPKQIASGMPANDPNRQLFAHTCDKDFTVR
jgi:hypothetical protein